jgi:hypothetical protein
MSKRKQHALIAQSGASNPRPLAQALVDAINESFKDGVVPENDPAVVLILHQLAHVLGQSLNMCQNDWQAYMDKLEAME